MEMTLEQMMRLTEIAKTIRGQHKDFLNPEVISTTFKPRGENMYLHINCRMQDEKWHNFRYKIDMNHNVEGEGWPVHQIGYDNSPPANNGS